MEQYLIYFYEYKEAIFIIILSIFLGIEVISNVPSVLHTPLMSGANAISGVISARVREETRTRVRREQMASMQDPANPEGIPEFIAPTFD